MSELHALLGAFARRVVRYDDGPVEDIASTRLPDTVPSPLDADGEAVRRAARTADRFDEPISVLLPETVAPGEPDPAALRAGDHAQRIADEAVLARFQALSLTEQMKLIEAELGKLSPEEQAHVAKLLGPQLARPFVPLPGPQTAALASPADLVLYGGAAGGGKSKLLLGAAANDHARALIVRRQSTELDGLVAESREMLAGRADLNKVDREWTFPDGRSLKFGGMKDADDWRAYAGRARDFIGFDEAPEFLESQVASLLGWLRSTDEDQRCRAILAGNPPRGAEGAWLIRWFAPWLDPNVLDVAAPGELRWCVTVDGEIQWVSGPEPVVVEGETYTPQSRTFIPARLDDNPFLSRTGYRAQLENLPEPLRSQLLHGDFLAGREDDAWQVIPSDWIMAARQRWQARPPEGVEMSALGVDVAQGGSDLTTLSPRHGPWFAPLVARKGVDTKDGLSVAGLVFMTMQHGCEIVIDLGGGWGADAYGHLKAQGVETRGVLTQQPSMGKTFDGKAAFLNLRAEMWWRFREALDPNKGASIALPPDPELVADLTAPRWKMRPGAAVIQIESKDEIRKRLGRSTDRADAVVQAWAGGQEAKAQRRIDALPSHANVAHVAMKRPATGGPRQATAHRGYANRR